MRAVVSLSAVISLFNAFATVSAFNVAAVSVQNIPASLGFSRPTGNPLGLCMDSMLCDVDKKRSVPFAPIRRFLSLVPRSKRSDQSEQTRYAPFAHLRRFAAKVLSAMGQTILSGHDDLLPDDGGNFDDHDHLGPHEVIALSADHQYMVSVFTRNTLADLQYRLGNMALDDKNDISVSSSVDFLVEHLEGVPDALSEKVGKKPKESLRAPSASEGMLAKSLSE